MPAGKAKTKQSKSNGSQHRALRLGSRRHSLQPDVIERQVSKRRDIGKNLQRSYRSKCGLKLLRCRCIPVAPICHHGPCCRVTDSVSQIFDGGRLG